MSPARTESSREAIMPALEAKVACRPAGTAASDSRTRSGLLRKAPTRRACRREDRQHLKLEPLGTDIRNGTNEGRSKMAQQPEVDSAPQEAAALPAPSLARRLVPTRPTRTLPLSRRRRSRPWASAISKKSLDESIRRQARRFTSANIDPYAFMVLLRE